ncbi:fungal-specific transcription factor domain-containing protein [Terfezia claveryi]|nr:fungal-specific transcription factor domain-containing protein [Terfezia claveryi]
MFSSIATRTGEGADVLGEIAHSWSWLKTDNAINLDSYVKLGEFIAQQLGEVETGMPNSANLISISGSSPRSSSPVFEVLTPAGWLSPDPSNPNSPLSPPSAFPPDFLSSPAVLQSRGLLTGWSPATAITYALTPKSRILDNVDNQELFQYYLDVPAQRLVDSSPSYIDVFRKYIPAMAQESPALMEGLLGLASIQQELAEGKDDRPSVKTIMHYQRALEMHYQSLKDPDALESDIPLATSLILSHYELWSGELIKLGVHMIGCRDIIELRGKAAYMTPVGRALFAAFRRLDVSTSLISGNPSFQTDDWWTVDPLTRTPILEGSPALLSADAAFSKLCVICSRLCHLKAWIIRRRREVHQSVLDCPEEIRKSKREALEAKIGLKVSKLEDYLGGWLGELPQCFKPLEEEEGDVEDINTTEIYSITPKLYKHKAIGLVVAYGIGVRLQLYRLRYPDIPVLGPEAGSHCHTMLRIFAGLPTSCDGAMTAPLFAAGIELRQKSHQEWFLSELATRIGETGLHALKFLREGVRFAYLKLDGMHEGRFIKIKEGAASRIDGVSENLWSAEGMLCSMEALSLYEPDTSPGGTMFTFQGDFDLAEGLDFTTSGRGATEKEVQVGVSGVPIQRVWGFMKEKLIMGG